MKAIYRILFILHIFVGLGGIAGGLAAIIDPIEPMGITIDALKYSPFSNYFIPGILLFGVIGIGNIFSAIVMRFKSKYQAYISSIFGCALVIWIIVQCIMLRSIVFLHVLFFVIGFVQVFFALIVLLHENLFPANIYYMVTRGLKKKYPESIILKHISRIEKQFDICTDE